MPAAAAAAITFVRGDNGSREPVAPCRSAGRAPGRSGGAAVRRTTAGWARQPCARGHRAVRRGTRRGASARGVGGRLVPHRPGARAADGRLPGRRRGRRVGRAVRVAGARQPARRLAGDPRDVGPPDPAVAPRGADGRRRLGRRRAGGFRRSRRPGRRLRPRCLGRWCGADRRAAVAVVHRRRG